MMRSNLTLGTLAVACLISCLAALPQRAFAHDRNASENVAAVEEGKALAFNRSKGNCLACHKIEGGDLPGNVGPELVNMKARYPDREMLFKRLWDESEYYPLTVMPPFGRNNILTKEEIEKVIDFLYTL